MTLDEVLADKKKLRRYFEINLPLTHFLEQEIQSNGVLKCPFHHDNNPSAKIYRDSSGGERLYCFTERKTYNSYDYVVNVLGDNPIKFLLKNFNMDELEDAVKDFEFQESSSAKESSVRYIEAIDQASEKLPNIVEFLSSLYPHAIKVTLDG